jgi:hypothetical protein
MDFAKRPSPSMVVAIIAVILAVGGTATAALTKKDKKKVTSIANQQIAAKASGLSVANSAALGGVPASGYTQGSGKQALVRAYVFTGDPSATLVNASGAGILTMDCSNTGQTITLTYTNTSGTFQNVNATVAQQGAASTVNVTGQSVNSGATVARTATAAGISSGAVFTFDAIPPITSPEKPTFSFRGSGWTKTFGDSRCAATGVATFG